jgi:hypothetical protein
MRELAAFAVIGSLLSLGFALAETKSPDPDGPKDGVVSGEFTSERVAADAQAFITRRFPGFPVPQSPP